MRYFEDNFNPEILEDLKSNENLVICSSLGSGKSTSVKKYIDTNKKQKILLVVNQIKDLKNFKEDLPDNLIYVDKDSRIKLKECVEIIHNSGYNCLAITKVRFNYMVTVKTKLFDKFNKIIIDESGGLNPVTQENFDDSLSNLLETLGKMIKLVDKEAYIKGKSLLDFLYKVNANFFNKKTVTKLLPISIGDSYRKIAEELSEHLLQMYEEDKIKEHNIYKVFGLLHNIIENKLFINEYNTPQGKKSSILFINNFLKEFIKEKNIPIKVLDGTAKFLTPLYTWLGIKIKDTYSINETKYPNMKIHFYKFDDVTPFEGRTNEEVKDRMIQFIKKEGLSSDFLLFTNKTSTETFMKHHSKVDYVFSGSDVGSNEYMDEKNLIVVFYNTFPQSIRILWNKDIKGLSIEASQSNLELEIAEYELLGSMMCQLVGRTAIRVDNNAEVNIYMFCVPVTTPLSVKHHFKIERENFLVYNCSLDLRKKTILSVAGLFYLIELQLKDKIDKININEIATEYYGDKLTSSSIRQIKSRNKEKFEKLAIQYDKLYNSKKWLYESVTLL
jgi:hypothetical protein